METAPETTDFPVRSPCPLWEDEQAGGKIILILVKINSFFSLPSLSRLYEDSYQSVENLAK
jgi:hypothetical protein